MNSLAKVSLGQVIDYKLRPQTGFERT